MNKKWIFLIAPPAAVLVIALFGELVMHLWNWLLPTLFGLHAITFWQGLGLLLLTRILFGSWSSASGNSHNRREKAARWDRMTPEEREKFRQDMRNRWCRVGAPPTETGEPNQPA